MGVGVGMGWLHMLCGCRVGVLCDRVARCRLLRSWTLGGVCVLFRDVGLDVIVLLRLWHLDWHRYLLVFKWSFAGTRRSGVVCTDGRVTEVTTKAIISFTSWCVPIGVTQVTREVRRMLTH